MAMVSVQGVMKQFGTQIVLEEVSFELRAGETVGLIGANGSGKTTLFRLIAGELEPDLGAVRRGEGVTIGLLRQDPDVELNGTLHDTVADAFTELLAVERTMHDVSERMAACKSETDQHKLMAEYDRLHARFVAMGGHSFETRLHEVLGGLGFALSDYERPVSILSGGQRCRAALARLLLLNRRLLLLDEPTNHLDIDAVRWLEAFLSRHEGGAVLVSHDRYLLDRVCDRIMELEHARMTGYPGDYSNFARVKELRRLTDERRAEQDAEFIQKERAFIAKHIAGQRTKEAQGRRKRLERRIVAGEFTQAPAKQSGTARLRFGSAETATGTVVRVDELAMAYGDHSLFSDLSLQVQAAERLAITGPNGTGKTTLLKIILGEVTATSGRVIIEPGLRIGYYSQEGDLLDPSHTVLEEFRAARGELSEAQARSLAARFAFRGEDVFKPIEALSGGERSRVRLATLILDEPDLLILDEPTNHLDIPSREVLETALVDFRGTMIVVSHDRFFLDRIAERLLVIRGEGHALFDGNYSFYEAQLARERQNAGERTASRKKSKRAPRPAPAESRPRPKFDHLSVEELEQMVIAKEVELASLQERFGDPQVYKDPDLLAELREEAEAMECELHEVDAAWQERVEEH